MSCAIEALADSVPIVFALTISTGGSPAVGSDQAPGREASPKPRIKTRRLKVRRCTGLGRINYGLRAIFGGT